MKTIADLKNLKGKRVIMRVDFNVPIEGSVVMDDFRIRKTIPTIEKLREKGARVILMSHLEGKGGDSLRPVFNYLRTFFPITFIEDIESKEAEEVIKKMSNTEVVLLENLRKWKGEKANDPKFAKRLASFADIYVNEAFPTSHREHASIVGVPKYIPGVAGNLFMQEFNNLKVALEPQSPALFIFGGAKFSTKLPLLKKFLDRGEKVVVAGALMNNFYQIKGLEVGKSLVEEGYFDINKMLEDQDLYLPVDVVVQDKAGRAEIKEPNKVAARDVIMDVGPKTIEDLQTFITESKFILWNGPLGNYEKGFDEGTKELAHRIAESGKDSIVGGGDTVAVIAKLQLLDKFTFVSTAGGAMLDFLEDGILPGVEILN